MAVLLGLVSVVFSWRADSKAGDALKKASALSTAPASGIVAPATTAPVADPTATAEDTTTTDPAPGPSGTDPELNPETQFRQKYVDQSLHVPVPTCSPVVNIDLDEPRVSVDSSIAEFYVGGSCDGGKTPHINLSDGVRGSIADSDKVTPTGCVDLIRRSPLLGGDQPIRQGQVYCINTSKGAADASADTWKMVIMTISAISADGTVSISASSWDIPD